MESVLSEDTLPASKLVILLVASVPCAALNAVQIAELLGSKVLKKG